MMISFERDTSASSDGRFFSLRQNSNRRSRSSAFPECFHDFTISEYFVTTSTIHWTSFRRSNGFRDEIFSELNWSFHFLQFIPAWRSCIILNYTNVSNTRIFITMWFVFIINVFVHYVNIKNVIQNI